MTARLKLAVFNLFATLKWYCADEAAYRPMTVLTHYFSVPTYLFKIDRSCFFPVPSVHGAVVTFDLLPPTERPAVQNEREFQMFVRQAFLSKRKMLANSLLPKWQRENVNAALSTLGFSSTARFFRTDSHTVAPGHICTQHSSGHVHMWHARHVGMLSRFEVLKLHLEEAASDEEHVFFPLISLMTPTIAVFLLTLASSCYI
jgi:hypothetical protein